MKLDLPPEDFAAVAGPLLQAAAGVIAQHLARCAAAMAEDASQGYMDKAAAMKYVKLESERALETWMKPVKDGGRGMPHMKIGETVRFSRARIDAWMLTLERNTPPLLKPLEAAA